MHVRPAHPPFAAGARTPRVGTVASSRNPPRTGWREGGRTQEAKPSQLERSELAPQGESSGELSDRA
eukprot:3233071-Alexandrium_andersonii.AAC.1